MMDVVGEGYGWNDDDKAQVQRPTTVVTAPRNPKLIRGTPKPVKLTPSGFMLTMSQSTHERLSKTKEMRVPKKVELLDMGETTYQKTRRELQSAFEMTNTKYKSWHRSMDKISLVDIDDCLFQPYPSEIYFQKFKPFETYEIPLLMRNNDSIPRLIKVTAPDSPYFKVVSPPHVGHKVGAGLPVIFKVQFTPEDLKDYQIDLVCTTERERFIIPAHAIGSRAILDFPDRESGLIHHELA